MGREDVVKAGPETEGDEAPAIIGGLHVIVSVVLPLFVSVSRSPHTNIPRLS